MRNLLLSVLSLSLSGSLAALVLLALKPLCKRYMSRTWQYYIWVLVLARLLLPIGPQNNLMQMAGERFGEVVPLSEAVQGVPAPDAPEVQTDPGSEIAMAPNEAALLPDADNSQDPAVEENGLLFAFTWFQLAGALWPGVAVVLLLRKMISYAMLTRQIKRSSTPCEDPRLLRITAAVCQELHISLQPAVFINNYIPSPMLVGTFRPFIALPADSASHKNLRYILQHELTHLKRGDVFYKWAAQIAVYIHWFNPVVYLVQREIGRCCELACDEAVVRCLEESEKSRYGEAILDAIKPAGTKICAGVSLSMSEDTRQLKERLISIMQYKKKSRWAAGIAVMLTAILLCGATYAGAYTAPRPQPAENDISGTGTLSTAQVSTADLNTVTIKDDTWYLIDNEQQLRGLGLGRYPLDGKYLLNADITLDKTVDWIPVGSQETPFTGTFNGNGHEIIDLTITSPAVDVIGMFACAENADIYNVTLRRPDIESAFTPGNSIGPVLVLGKNCNSFDNRIIDPVEQNSTPAISTTGSSDTGSTRRTESLIQDFAPFASHGVVYHPESDTVTHHGDVVKLFVVFKPSRAEDVTFSFDLLYRDKTADSNLYLEAVRDSSGSYLEIRPLDVSIAEELLRDLEGAYAARADSSKPDSKPENEETVHGPYNFDATFNWTSRGISATDKFDRNNMSSAVTDWLGECDRQQGAYILRTEISGGKTTCYIYYNGGGRYPWNLKAEDGRLSIELYSDSIVKPSDGYHLMYVTISEGYRYSEIKLLLDGAELEWNS